jgi:hypothetical protein
MEKKERATAGYLRRKEADRSRMDMALSMLRRAWKQGIRASYAPTDSRFTSANMIESVRPTGKGSLHLVGLVKMGKQKYLGWGGRQCRDFDAQIVDCTLTFITHAVNMWETLVKFI